MGKRVKKLFLSVLMAVFGAMSLVGPVFAVPADTNSNNGTGTETPSIGNVAGDKEINEALKNNNNDPGAYTPSIGNVAGDKEINETLEESKKNSTNDSKESDAAKVSKSCSDQVGSLSWIICPGTGLLGSIIDGAYNILTSLMQVNPIPNDEGTPMYIVWDYFKNFTNSVFIIFLIVVILSQLTGIGISNYGIKKVLPRIIITAILVNLSYIICTLAVDLSNIFGIGLRGIFENIENIAVSNGSISDVARNISASSIIAGVIGIGGATAAVGGALVVYGGLEGAIWMLLPIILSGVFAVVSALITMAARQSLIFILAMISPLALVAYMLPNTESWFTKWYKLFMRMLIFYPLFSILYGASSLAGLVIITSSISDNAAANSLGVILGLAVRILPLFASIPLMKMSGTVLDKVGSTFSKLTTPIAAAVGGYAGSKQAVAKQKQLSAVNPKAPSTRLAQYLAKRKALREADAKDMATMHQDNVQTYIMQSRYDRYGRVNSRGMRIYNNSQQQLHNKAVRQQIENDFDEGFKSDGTDKRVKNKDLRRIERINEKIGDAVVEEHIANTRKITVQRNNEVERAEKIRAALDFKTNDLDNHIHEQVLAGFNIDKTQLRAALDKQAMIESGALQGVTLTEAEKRLINFHNEGKSFVLADAIATKRKADNVMASTMYELLDDTTAGSIPKEKLIESFKNKDYNSMKAAITVMSKRGDHDAIIEVLTDYSKLIVGDENPQNIRMQKELNDTLLGLKGEDALLWSDGKANMIRRGKHDGGDSTVAGFTDFLSFDNCTTVDGDADFYSADYQARLNQLKTDLTTGAKSYSALTREETDMLKAEKTFNMINRRKIIENVRDNKLLGDTDRTVFKQKLEMGAKGLTTDVGNAYYITFEKGFRDSVCSGKMDGEQLESFLDYYTMGFGTTKQAFFEENYDTVEKHINEFLRDMGANQLASFKSAALMRFNDVLNWIDTNKNGMSLSDAANTVACSDDKTRYVNRRLLRLLENEVSSLNSPNMNSTRSGMNPVIREMLGIKLSGDGR